MTAKTTCPAGAPPVWEAERPARVPQWQGEDGGVQRAHLDGAERSGEDGVQGGHLQQHDHRLREARHQGLHLDAAQGEGGVGRQLQVDSPLPVVTVLLWTIASLLLNPHRIGSTQIVLMLDALSWPMWLTTEQSAINISRKSLVWIYFLVWCGVDKTTFWKCTALKFWSRHRSLMWLGMECSSVVIHSAIHILCLWLEKLL